MAELLAVRGLRMATAESCTGGWLAKVLTDLAGSSVWYERGWVTYSNAAKQADLGVPAQLLAVHGAVSEPVVRAMALGALERAAVDFTVAISGVAGPAGGSVAKPVGTVWLAWAWREAGSVQTRALPMWFAGDREAVRWQAVISALNGLLETLARLPVGQIT